MNRNNLTIEDRFKLKVLLDSIDKLNNEECRKMLAELVENHVIMERMYKDLLAMEMGFKYGKK